MTRPLALIIEDETDLAEIFSEALKAAGFGTEVVNRGDTALERLSEIEPAVVILDLHLPGVDGREILKHIRADNRHVGAKVILASADAAMAESLDVDADLTLLKPISFGQLRDLTSRLI